MNVPKMLHSFKYAFKGVKVLLQENNARFHLLATVAVVLGGILLKLSFAEWSATIIAIGLVWMAEAFNTALEKLCDFVSEGYHPLIGKIKDLSAAAVLIISVCAAIIGIIIFLPKILANL
ncbi:diacylglycerol kinase family protein [Emticicia sp. 21SJ11W-3]|uniref:diacylglycerol kinase family protein n=1 Tax=Emticicia sp. 21SJ11W-3 TaxID=2916755 RepID=UPI00209ECAAE|nr:diacylglycerol kinase family protein [Emticicia sp. 21SJ11W-3]UTA69334.1 diacylglycerol kinase family protein [Emticicia sp. 21SJ11W-3]